MFKYIKRLSHLALGAALLIAAGCGGDDGGGGGTNPTGTGDTTPPTLVSMTPDNGTDRVPTNAPVVATFSENIDPSSISSANFFVLGVTGSVSVNGAEATFTPDDYLAPTTGYSAQLGAGVTDLAGNATSSGTQAQFTTAPLPTASAGGDVVASRGQPFQLDGTSSVLAPRRVPGLEYEWVQVSGPDVGGPYSGETPTVTAPDAIGSLVFELSVFEQGTKSFTDQVTVVVVEDASTALFVDANASNGDGSFEAPFTTLVDAIGAAQAARMSTPSIYMTAGTYPGRVDLTSMTQIYGGFDPETWERDPLAHTTRVEGDVTAIFMDGASGSILDGLTIVAADATEAGESSVGVHLLNSTDVDIRNCIIEAGNGAMGGPGSKPGRPDKQSNGGGGDNHGGCIPSRKGGGGGGGSNSNAQGGAGGSGGLYGGGKGGGGEGAGGNAGNGGSTYQDGKDGAPGTGGGRGSDGAAGGDFAGIGTAGFYEGRLARGGTGGRGGRAGGGGGGGGGGGDSLAGCGAGGGGGGEGGYGGHGGTGGYGGGGSVGVMVALNSTVEIVGCSIRTANGGQGGGGADGGPGGYGGSGGSGGNGRSAAPFVIRKGWGGDGGNGGTGGPGGFGAGGGGGPSLGILQSSDSAVIVGATDYVIGNAGPGGTPFHADGLNGNTGITSEFKVVDPEVPKAPERWETAR